MLQHAVVQELFTRQRTLACGQHFVFKLFQFFGDIALGTGQGLPPRVVHRRFVGLALADFDEVAVHAVVAHFQGGNATGCALALFQINQELVGMGG